VASRPIIYTSSVDEIETSSLAGGFFEGWATPLTPAEHLQLLRSASHVVLALDGSVVVGFVNALSDGVLSAYIPLLEVLPERRGQGIGSELVRRLLVLIGPLYMVDVMCDTEVIPFYERLGFSRGEGVVRRNYTWRSSPES
jgi:ribosomal protein S18 acetylase RimI-like enzyme